MKRAKKYILISGFIGGIITLIISFLSALIIRITLDLYVTIPDNSPLIIINWIYTSFLYISGILYNFLVSVGLIYEQDPCVGLLSVVICSFSIGFVLGDIFFFMLICIRYLYNLIKKHFYLNASRKKTL